MKKVVFFLIKTILLLEILFLSNRILFLSYNYGKINEIPATHQLLAHLYGLPLDLSAIGYIIALPCLLLLIGNYTQQRIILKTIHVFYLSIFIICSFVNIADTALAWTWGTKVTAKSLSYIFYPKLIKESVLSVNYKLLIAFFLVQCGGLFFVYHKWVKLKETYTIKLNQIYSFAIIIAVVFTMIRGGWGNNPIGKSRGMYSDNLILNLSTVNGFWNLTAVLLKDHKKEMGYTYFSKEKAEEKAACMLHQKGIEPYSIINTPKPNIVVILLEGFSSDNLICLGGKENIAPELEKQSKEGLFFTQFYATGFRTEQGFVALLSGFPSQPKLSIQRHSDKIFRLPIISKDLHKVGYHSFFFYTDDLQYGRTDEYLNLGRFEKIYSGSDFKDKPRTASGAYDEFLYDFQLSKLNQCPQPFFSVSLTSSTHAPCDGNFEKVFKGEGEVFQYKNAVHYSDKCLSDFLERAKKQAWYKNTLFVIMADHCSPLPLLRDYDSPEFHRIPLLFLGGALAENWKGKTYNEPATQTDLPASLLHLLGLPSDKYEFSNNLFDRKTPHFGFYTFDDGFALINETDTVIYDNNRKTTIKKRNGKPINTELLDQGKAYLQILMQRFSNLE